MTSITMNSIKAGLAAAFTAGAMIATPALAQSDALQSVPVQYSDLDLSTDEGQAALERRLDRAAQKVCGIDRRTSGHALPSAEARGCYREVSESFAREIAARTEKQQQRG